MSTVSLPLILATDCRRQARVQMAVIPALIRRHPPPALSTVSPLAVAESFVGCCLRCRYLGHRRFRCFCCCRCCLPVPEDAQLDAVARRRQSL